MPAVADGARRAPRSERASKRRGFTFIERDSDGDDAYQGRVDGRDAGVTARLAGDSLVRATVLLLVPDPQGALLQLRSRDNVGKAYSTPQGNAECRDPLARALGHSRLGHRRRDRRVTVHSEAADWPEGIEAAAERAE